MNWDLYRSLHARKLTQQKLATLTGLNRSVLAKILGNAHGRGKETRVRLFPHLAANEIKLLGWDAEYANWQKTAEQMAQSATSNIVPPNP